MTGSHNQQVKLKYNTSQKLIDLPIYETALLKTYQLSKLLPYNQVGNVLGRCIEQYIVLWSRYLRSLEVNMQNGK